MKIKKYRYLIAENIQSENIIIFVPCDTTCGIKISPIYFEFLIVIFEIFQIT